jgi:hypothetical protein
MTRVTLAAGLLACAWIAPASATHYLFPTDVVPAGQADASLGITATWVEIPFTVSFLPGADGTERFRTVEETADVDVGLGADTQARVALPYDSVNRACFSFSGTGCVLDVNDRGFRNLQFSVKHRFFADGGMSFSGTAGFSPNSAGKNGSTYSAGLDAGWAVADGARIFAGYEYKIPDHTTDANSHALDLGLFLEAQDSGVIFAPFAVYEYFESTPNFDKISLVALELPIFVRVYTDTYVGASGSYVWFGSTSAFNGTLQFGSSNSGWQAGLSLYHVFGGAGR